jgi:uncharacterized protein (TIGR02246 family)
MSKLKQLLILAATLLALVACAKTPAPDTAVADADAIRAVNVAWNKAYNAGDGAGIAALYTEDAVLMAPGAPLVRGKASISEYYAKDAAAFAAAGLTVADAPTSDVAQSGDLAWQSGTYMTTDKSGATVEAGKFLTVFQRKDGKWMIIRDTWNSDAARSAETASAAAPPPAAAPK